MTALADLRAEPITTDPHGSHPARIRTRPPKSKAMPGRETSPDGSGGHRNGTRSPQ
ncbi:MULTISPECIES: hypothetical protein [unclassified Methylobacterium]|uniref:hypothetical protein n=1 Tax=unclassified Methylobacterium TaxID=2615210 RepID=UPI0012F6FDB6|nr:MULTISPECIES: hypothetical protein [Methylobacterium]WFT81188.1 hypothetical protein QA634_04595 [Methylobacterium nodulans]